MQDFRKLAIWSRSHALAVALHRTTRRMLRSGSRSLRTQVLRSAESVVWNIVEGAGAGSQREFARFLEISIKSTTELEAQLEMAKDVGAMDVRSWQTNTAETVEIRRMICGFRKRVLERDANQRQQARSNRRRRRGTPGEIPAHGRGDASV